MNDLIEKIVNSGLGKYATWQKPKLLHSIGPTNPNVFDEFEGRIESIRLSMNEYLESKPKLFFTDNFDTEGELLYPGIYDKSGWQKFCNGLLKDLNADFPKWYAAGFGVPQQAMDVDYWEKIPTYKSRELVLLTVGLDPRKMSLQSFLEESRANPSTRDMAGFLSDRYVLLARNFNQKQRAEWTVSQSEFSKWIVKTGFEIYEPFRLALNRIDNPLKVKEEIDPREKTSLLQLIYLLAMDGYGFDPKSKRTELPKELFDMAELNGIKISRDTIRKHLYASAEPYSEPWKTE